MGSITPSMQLPFLSCACTGPELSDAETYENFLRMRHNMKVVPALVKALAQTMQWKQVSFMVGIVLRDGMSAKRFRSFAQRCDLQVHAFTADGAQSFAATRAVVEDFQRAKRRVIFMIGGESFSAVSFVLREWQGDGFA